MKKISLLFGIHMHQPVDNFGEAVDEAIQKCYKPFFETMAKYPEFKFSVHCSGWLLEQIVTKQPEIYTNIKKLTDSGSIEWISAGYYEPILSSIPSGDRVKQIKKLTSFIDKKFNSTPKGLWLTERVWNSAIVPDLKKGDIDFALVDDYHFLSSGFDKNKMDGYYSTEESGEKINLFPISTALRYALPFYSVDDALKSIEARNNSENSAAIIFDDAEKFGLWPKTHEWVYEKGWLKDFVEAVLKSKNIQTEHFEDFAKQNRSKGIAYLGNTSYIEMGEWSLKAKQTLALEELKQKVGDRYFEDVGIAFIKGGIWHNFFVKYEESNYLHKRMLYMSQKQKKMSKNELEYLYKLQTNDVFWHGVFGGLYLPNLRDNAYRFLLELEKNFAKNRISIEAEDIDMDGYDELKVLSKSLSLLFSSKNGAQMIEFGSLKSLFNWQNTLTRREEAYHQKILNPTPKEQSEDNKIETIHDISTPLNKGLKEELVYDWHLKYSFIDHFSDSAFSLENFKNVSFKEIGDFANQPFELDKKTTTFKRDGGIYLDGTHKTSLQKRYNFQKDSFSLNLTCRSNFDKKAYYGVEFNLHFAHPQNVLFNGSLITNGLNLKEIKTLEIYDDFTNQKIIIKMDKEMDLSAYILNTISQSESGFDKVAQQISFILSSEFIKDFDLTIEVQNV